ncbi:unnamed protein product [Paramecium pentaurelia]|uniref:Uncharacterized protein n=1 Tax=Paramecium pentaurelia TaxID=43138 RepID=A0A8S1WFN3_9CILI|nr:unnamed protein product [Paramecium pentaurelia]
MFYLFRQFLLLYHVFSIAFGAGCKQEILDDNVYEIQHTFSTYQTIGIWFRWDPTLMVMKKLQSYNPRYLLYVEQIDMNVTTSSARLFQQLEYQYFLLEHYAYQNYASAPQNAQHQQIERVYGFRIDPMLMEGNWGFHCFSYNSISKEYKVYLWFAKQGSMTEDYIFESKGQNLDRLPGTKYTYIVGDLQSMPFGQVYRKFDHDVVMEKFRGLRSKLYFSDVYLGTLTDFLALDQLSCELYNYCKVMGTTRTFVPLIDGITSTFPQVSTQHYKEERFSFSGWAKLIKNYGSSADITVIRVALYEFYSNDYVMGDRVFMMSYHYDPQYPSNSTIKIDTYSYDFPALSFYTTTLYDTYKKQGFNMFDLMTKWHYFMFESGIQSVISNVNIRIRDGSNQDPNYYDIKYNYQHRNHFKSSQLVVNLGGDKFSPSPMDGFLANVAMEYCFENDQTFEFRCHKICKTCFGPDKTHCLSCNDITTKVLKNNECLCIRNYYEDENNSCQTHNFYLGSLQLVQSNINNVCQDDQFLIPVDTQIICQKCPSSKSDFRIICSDCLLNQKTWYQNPICSQDYIKQQVGDVFDGNSAFQLLQRDKVDYEYYLISKDGNLNLCDGCLGIVTDDSQLYILQYQLDIPTKIYCKPCHQIINNKCVNININCLECDQDFKCLTCQSNYQLLNSECIKCPIHECDTCKINEGNIECASCPLSTYLNNGTCIKCGQNCQICDHFRCHKCIDINQYYLSLDGLNCYPNPIPNCLIAFERVNGQRTSTLQYNYPLLQRDQTTIIECALCKSNYINKLTSCSYSDQMSDIEQSLDINNDGNILQLNIQIIKATQCQNIESSNVNIDCQSPCFQCVKQNQFILDGWKQQLVPFYLSYFSSSKFDSATDLVDSNLLYSKEQLQIHCSSCREGYQLHITQCIPICQSNCECQIINNQNVCYKCKSNERGQQLSLFDGQCIECPYNCAHCKKRTNAEIKLINQYFDPQYTELLIYGHQCLIPYIDTTLFYDIDIGVYVECSTTLCENSMKLIINYYCDLTSYNTAKSSYTGTLSEFQKYNILLTDYESFQPFYETQFFYQIMNQRTLKTISFEVSLISSNVYCELPNNFTLATNLRRNIFTLINIPILIKSNANQLQLFTKMFQVIGFSSVTIQNLQITNFPSTDIQIYISDSYGFAVTIQDILFSCQNVKLSIIINNPKSIKCNSLIFKDMIVSNSYGIFMYQGLDIKDIVQVEFINVKVINTILTNSSLIVLSLLETFQNQNVKFNTFLVQDSQFIESKILQTNYQTSTRQAIVQLNQLKIIKTIFITSTFLTFEGFLNVKLIDCQLEQSSFKEGSIWLLLPLFQLQNIKINDNTLETSNDRFITNKATVAYSDSDNDKNSIQIQNLIFENNQFASGKAFIEIYQDVFTGLIIEIIDLNIHLNQLFGSSNKYKQRNIVSENSTIYLDVLKIQLKNVDIIRKQSFPELAILNSIDVQIINLNAQHSEFKTSFLHNAYLCAERSIFVQGYTALMYIYNAKNIKLDKIQLNNLRSVNLPLILIKSSDKMKVRQNENIIIQNSYFSQNLLLLTAISEQQAIIQISSEQYQNVIIKNVTYFHNYQHSYIQDLSFISSSTILFSSPYSTIIMEEVTFERNMITNGQNSNLVLKCLTILIINCSFLQSNLPPLDTIQQNIYWGIQQDQVLYFENYTQSFPIYSQGGSAYLSANSLDIQNVLVLESRSQKGGAFYIAPVQYGIINIQNITFLDCRASLEKVSSAQGGTIYIDASLSQLDINITNAEIIRSYSRREGGVFFINPSKVKNLISLINIIVSESYSLFYSFIKIPYTSSVDVYIENLIVSNTYSGFKDYLGLLFYLSEIELSTFQKSYFISLMGNLTIYMSTISNQFSGLFEIQTGQAIFKQMSISNCLIYSQPIMIFTSVNLLSFQNFRMFNISIYQYDEIPVQSLEITYQALQMECTQETSKPSYLYDGINSSIINYYGQHNIKSISQSFNYPICLIQIDSIQKDYKIAYKDSQFQMISCPNCQKALILHTFKAYYDLGVNIVKIENIRFNQNICGYSCFVFLQQNNNRLLALSSSNKEKLIYTVSVKKSEFHSNIGQNGGVFYVDDMNLLIDSCIFNYNQATQSGGVVYFISKSATFNIYDSDLTSNTAQIGGAFYLHNYTLNSPDRLNLRLINNQANKYGKNYAEYPSQLTVSLDGEKTQLEKKLIFSNSTTIIDLISIQPYSFNNETKDFIVLPSGQAISNYKYYNETTQQFVSYNLTFRILALNKQYNKIQNLDNSKCSIKSQLVSKQTSNQESPKILSEQTSSFTNLKEVKFDTEYQDYNLDDMIIYFDPTRNSEQVLQLEFVCDSVRIPIFNSEPPYLLNKLIEDYRLRVNVQSLDCQLGEQKRLDDGTCVVCDSTLDQYSVQAGQQCQTRDSISTEAVTSASVKLRAGFWRPYTYSVRIEYCLNMEINCEGGWIPGNPSCFTGHIGALCEQCDVYNIEGKGSWSMSGQYKCGSCDQIGDNTIKVALVSAWTIISIMLSVKSTMEMVENMVMGKKLQKFYVENPKTGYGGILIKVLTNYLQIIGVVATFQLSLPSALSEAFKTVGTPVESMSYSLDCFLIHMTQIDILYFRMIWALIMPLIYILTFSILYIIAIIVGIVIANKSAISTTLIYLFTFLQPTLLGGFISLLSFRQISDIYWIQGNVSYRYDTSTHVKWLITFVLPSALMLGLIIPTYLFLNLYKIRSKLDDENNRKNWGYLYNEYQPKAYFWEIVKVYQKSFIITFLTFYEDLIIIKAALVFIIVFIYSGLTKKYRPYKLPFLNQIDDISTLVCGTSIVLGMTLYSANLTNNQEIIWPFYILLIVINAAFILVILWEILWANLENQQAALDKLRDKLNSKFPNLVNKNWLTKRLFTNRGEQILRIKRRWRMIRNYLFDIVKKQGLVQTEDHESNMDQKSGSLPGIPKYYNKIYPENFIDHFGSDLEMSI